MTCKLTMTLVSEHQEGDCGEDWKYDLDVKVFHEGLKAKAGSVYRKHNLVAGSVKEPYGSPEPQVVFAGECLTELLVRMELTATEVDLFVNDVGKASKDITIECPGPHGDKVTKEVDIAAGVREAPAILNKTLCFYRQSPFYADLRLSLRQSAAPVRQGAVLVCAGQANIAR